MADTSSPAVPHHQAAPSPEVVRHEEQLRTSTVSVPVERVRLKKVIVTEEKTYTVQIRREELRLEHDTLDPATATVTDPGPSDLELILHEERIIITREIVPVERIRLTRRHITGHQAVEATLRHEDVILTTPIPSND